MAFGARTLPSPLTSFPLSDDQTSEQDAHWQLHVDLKDALIGGGIAAVVTAAITLFVGNLSAGEAQAHLDASLPTMRFLCASVMTAAATTLALMLTLLSVSSGTEHKLKPAHYHRVQQIALVDTVAFVGATVLLLLLAMPFGEAEHVPSHWYDAIYYLLTGLSALLGGTLIAVMLMLYKATCDMITVFAPDMETSLIAEEEEEASSQEGSS